MSTNNVQLVASQAVQAALQALVTGTVVPSASVLKGDEDNTKVQQPLIVCIADENIEEISPGCGIYTVPFKIEFRSHIKETTTEDRDLVIQAITNFAYTDPASTLSGYTGFHCYGFVINGGKMAVDVDEKSYNYTLEFTLHCMPSDGITQVPNTVVVTGSGTPFGVAQTYDHEGEFGIVSGSKDPLFINRGSPAFFLFFNNDQATYIISDTLTHNDAAKRWVPSPLITSFPGPGTYTFSPQGTASGTATLTVA